MTAAYAAPEVIEHGGGWPTSDVWSLAATLYALLAGHPPFYDPRRPDPRANLRAYAGPLPPIGNDVPPEVERVLARALIGQPDDRTTSARIFAEQLSDCLRHLGLPPVPVSNDGPGAGVTRRPRSSPPTPRTPGSTPAGIRAAGTAAVPDMSADSRRAISARGASGSTAPRLAGRRLTACRPGGWTRPTRSGRGRRAVSGSAAAGAESRPRRWRRRHNPRRRRRRGLRAHRLVGQAPRAATQASRPRNGDLLVPRRRRTRPGPALSAPAMSPPPS